MGLLYTRGACAAVSHLVVWPSSPTLISCCVQLDWSVFSVLALGLIGIPALAAKQVPHTLAN